MPYCFVMPQLNVLNFLCAMTVRAVCEEQADSGMEIYIRLIDISLVKMFFV